MILFESLKRELKFSFSPSSGPGGQHVNKVNTRVTLSLDIANSDALDEDQKSLLFKRLKSKVTVEGVLAISSQKGRSQLANKQDTIKKFKDLLLKAFAEKKKRKPTKPSKASIEKRLDKKKRLAEKKSSRKKLS